MIIRLLGLILMRRLNELGSRAALVSRSVRLVCLKACGRDGSVEGWFLVLFRGDNSR